MPLDLEKLKISFFAECHDLLDGAEKDIEALGQGDNNPEILNNLFRSIHTIKGNSGIFDFNELIAFAHNFESDLQNLRENKATLNPSGYYQTIDNMRALLEKADKPKESFKIIKEDNPNSATQSLIRVQRSKIDDVVNAFGDVLIHQARLTNLLIETELDKLSPFVIEFNRLKRQMKHLQDQVLAIRAQPISTLFSRMPKIVRQAAESLKKEVKLVIKEQDMEIDNMIIEGLTEPLIHILRNAVDHGIETKAVRCKAGKSEQGTITLASIQKQDRVIIEITDDGQGINLVKVRDKACKNNLIQKGQKISPKELTNLIFLPGFSTSQEISTLSGRGVGLDAVKASIEKLSGTISLKSEEGKGTTIIISLPLTLAILDGMLIRVGTQVFVMPLADIYEIIPLKDFENGHYSLPLIDLSTVFDEPSPSDNIKKIVIISEQQDKALLVDSLIGHQQVVVKGLEAHYMGLSAIGGATILGDGSIAVIIDFNQLHTFENTPNIVPFIKKNRGENGEK